MDFYRVFDLTFAAGFPIPEFGGAEIGSGSKVDVTILRGDVPEKLENAVKFGVCYQLGRNALQLNVEGIARYLAREGSEIIVDSEPDADFDAVRSFLLDAPLTGIMHQRGMLPLYGCAVQVRDHCVLFCGISGSGKSTTAREFIKRGYKLLTDDLAVITEQNGELIVLPGYPSQRLPLDVIKRGGLDPDDYPAIRQGIRQRRVPVLNSECTGKALPLKKVYIITTWNKTGIELKELEEDVLKFNLLHDTMHRQYLSGMGSGFALVKLTARLMNHMPAAQVIHPRTVDEMENMIGVLSEDMEK